MSQFEAYPLKTPKDVALTLNWSMRCEENHEVSGSNSSRVEIIYQDHLSLSEQSYPVLCQWEVAGTWWNSRGASEATHVEKTLFLVLNKLKSLHPCFDSYLFPSSYSVFCLPLEVLFVGLKIFLITLFSVYHTSIHPLISTSNLMDS